MSGLAAPKDGGSGMSSQSADVSPSETGVGASNEPRVGLLVVVPDAAQERWVVARAEHVATDQALTIVLEDSSTEVLATHRSQKRAMRTAQRVASDSDRGARILTHAHESLTRVVFEAEWRRLRVWLLVTVFAVGVAWDFTPETWQGAGVLAAIGALFVAVAVTGLTQAAFAATSRAPARTAERLRIRIVGALMMMAAAGALLLMWAAVAAFAEDIPVGVVFMIGATVAAGLVVLLSLVQSLAEYALMRHKNTPRDNEHSATPSTDSAGSPHPAPNEQDEGGGGL